MAEVIDLLQAYHKQSRHYPAVRDIEELERALGKKIPIHDGWGNRYIYVGEPAGYFLISTGRCGMIEAGEIQTARIRETRQFDADIIVYNGTFIQCPEAIWLPAVD